MDVNLNLKEYSYAELLNLFKLPPDYTLEELKQAKRIVTAVHPDKSGLDGKYFIFFNKAYQVIVEMYDIKRRKVSVREVEEENPTLAKFSKDRDFNSKFNSLFEKYYIRSDDGYGEWLKSADNEAETFETRKKQSRAIVCSPVEPLSKSTFSASSIGGQDEYTSLKQIYTVDTVLGVSEEDLTEPPRTLTSVQNARAVKVQPLTREEADRVLQKNSQEDDQKYMRQMYSLLKEQEAHAMQTKKFVGHLMQLT
jgi:hypothetical protein